MAKQLLEVYDLLMNRLCILNPDTTEKAKNITEEFNLNGINVLTFDLPLNSPNWKYIINEHLVKWNGEFYKIKNPQFKHSRDEKTITVECKHLSVGLMQKLCPTYNEIGKNAEYLIDKVLENSGWQKGVVAVDSSKYRALQTQEQSVFSNLVKIAELFESMLLFNSTTKQVDLISNKIDRNIQIRVGKNLKEININYDSNENIVTRLYAFGGNDILGIPVNLLGATEVDENENVIMDSYGNPVIHQTTYIEDYSYYQALYPDISVDYFKSNPHLFLHEKTWNNTEYISRDDLYRDAIKKIKTICKPKIDCSLNAVDLSTIPEYKTERPILGETIYVYDIDLDLEIEAKITNLKVNYDNPMDLQVQISDIIEYNSILKSLVDNSSKVNKVTTAQGEINGIYIKDATIDSAKIKSLDAGKITTGDLNADRIKGGTLTLGGTDNGNGLEVIKDNTGKDIVTLNKDGISVVDGKVSITDDNGTLVLNGDSINADKINMGTIDANIIDVVNLDADNINTGTLSTDRLSAGSITADKMEVGTITAESAILADGVITNAKISNLSVTTGKIADLAVDNSKIANASITNAKIQDASISTAKIIDGTITNAKIQNLAVDTAKIQDASITTVKIGDAQVTNAKISNLDAEKITTGIISADRIGTESITANKIATGTITAESGVIANGAIGNAHISSVQADKLTSGTLDTSSVTVQGTNGRLKISGNRLQVFDEDEQQILFERVAIGDVNADGSVYGFRVRGEDGITLLIDENGVHEEGITDGAITNNKISDNANISGTKLDIATVVTAINNGTTTITGSKIYLTDKTLDVAFSEIETTQTSQGQTIENHTSSITQLNNEIVTKVESQTFTDYQSSTNLRLNSVESKTTDNAIINTVTSSDVYTNDMIDINSAIETAQSTANSKALPSYVDSQANSAETNAKNYTDTQLNDFVSSIYNVDISDLQNQIDGNITSWFYDGVPTLSNNPAVTWNTDDLKNNHLGDLYYDNLTGYAYRFRLNNSVYEWLKITDTDVTKALADASKAQDTADGKRTVFTATPTIPYYIGDLWLTSTADSSGDLKKCIITRTTGSYTDSDWVIATKYTDDTVANNAQATANNAVTSANTANSLLSDIANDNKLTPSEKQDTKKEWDIIVSEKTINDNQADVFGITTEKTNYDNAYNTLSTYITPLLSNLTTTSDIVGTTFRTNFKNYYDARTNLLNAIAVKAKTLADNAQTSANTANSNLTITDSNVTVLQSKMSNVEQKITDESIINTVTKSETYLEYGLVPNKSTLVVTRNAQTINPLSAYNYIEGNIINANELIIISNIEQDLVYVANLQIVNEEIVIFDKPAIRIESAESKIEQQADKISLIVKEDDTINGGALVSAINLEPDTIKISSKNIDITGAVTFSSLDTDTQTKLTNGDNAKTTLDNNSTDWTDAKTKVDLWKHSTDTTKIDGGEIYTGSITADKITAGSITSTQISTEGITADKIKGGTLTLGGLNNTNGSMIIKDENSNNIIEANKDSNGRYNIRAKDSNGNVRAVFGEYADNNYGMTIYNQYGDLVTGSERPSAREVNGIGVAGAYLSVSNETSYVVAETTISSSYPSSQYFVVASTTGFTIGDTLFVTCRNISTGKYIIADTTITNISGSNIYISNNWNGTYDSFNKIYKLSSPTVDINISNGFVVNRNNKYIKISPQTITRQISCINTSDADGFIWTVVYLDENDDIQVTALGTSASFYDNEMVAGEAKLDLAGIPDINSLNTPLNTTITTTLTTGGILQKDSDYSTYAYEITAIMEDGTESYPSSMESASVSDTQKTINVSWTSVANAVGYNVYRIYYPDLLSVITGQGIFSLLTSTIATNFTDDGSLEIRDDIHPPHVVVLGGILSGIPIKNNISYPNIQTIHQVFHDPAIRSQLPYYVDNLNQLTGSFTNYIQYNKSISISGYSYKTILLPIGLNKKSTVFGIGTGSQIQSSYGFFGITGRRNHFDSQQHLIGLSPSNKLYMGEYSSYTLGQTITSIGDKYTIDGSYLCLVDAYITELANSQALKITLWNGYSSTTTKNISINAHAF